MKKIMMAVMMGLSGAAYAGTGTMETLIAPMIAAGITDNGVLNNLSQDKLKGLYEDGEAVPVNELAGGSLVVLYEMQNLKHPGSELTISAAKDNTFNVIYNAHAPENISGTESAIVIGPRLHLKVKKLDAEGKTYLVFKYTLDSGWTSSTCYGLLIKK